MSTIPPGDVDAAMPLVVQPDKVARLLDFPLPMADDLQWKVEEAIRQAQGTVVAYLGQSITPRQVTLQHRWPHLLGWGLPDDDVRDFTAAPELDGSGALTGYYTLTYTTGLDAATDPALAPIRDYVVAAAMNAPTLIRVWQQTATARGPAKTVSAEGQSITYSDATLGGGGTAGSGLPGALLALSSLDGFKVPPVWQRPSERIDRPWGRR
jgi:hypothetical protein